MQTAAHARTAALIARAARLQAETGTVLERSRDLRWLGHERRRGHRAYAAHITGGSAPPPQIRSACVLVVDDRPEARYVTVRTLEAARHYDVRETGTGRDALRLAQLYPDVIVLDICLPDIDGFEVCRRLKADPRTAAIAVLLKTSVYEEDEVRNGGLACGANAWLRDPVEPGVLIEAVERVLQGQGGRQVVLDPRRAAVDGITGTGFS